MKNFKVRNDVLEDGVLYLKAGKEYEIKSIECNSNKEKISVVVESEIKEIDLLIEIDRALVIKGSTNSLKIANSN